MSEREEDTVQAGMVGDEKAEATKGEEKKQPSKPVFLPSKPELEPVYDMCDVPKACGRDKPCCLGIDEAGRGPVLGPMIFGVAYWPLEEAKAIEKLGFNGRLCCATTSSCLPRKGMRNGCGSTVWWVIIDCVFI